MRTKLFFIVLPLLALVSCQREEIESIQDSPAKGQEIKIIAGFGDADLSTRTTISSNGKVFWSPGEAINIFYGPSGESSGSKFVSQNTEAASTVVFTGTITAFTGITEAGDPLSFWGVYPYSESNRCDGSSVVLELPVVQNAVEENFEDNTVPMVAQAPGLALPFYNVCSMIRFSLVNSDIMMVKVRGNNGETVAGRVSVSMGSDGKPVWSDTDGEGSKSVTLNAPSGGTFEAGKFYYIAILPGEYTNGYTMEFYTSDGRYGKRVRGSSITFNRNESTKQSDRDQGVTFTPLYVDMGDGIKWAKMNVGANSPEEYGDYFAWGETEPKKDYTWATYKHMYPNMTSWTGINKYQAEDNKTNAMWYSNGTFIGDGKTSFEDYDYEDDAARKNWGGTWRTPTDAEWTNLRDSNQYEWTWTDNYNGTGVEGYTVTSKVPGYLDNQIFLPAAGERGGTNLFAGTYGHYYSSSIYKNFSRYAWHVYFYSGYLSRVVEERYRGYSVRPVSD